MLVFVNYKGDYGRYADGKDCEYVYQVLAETGPRGW